MTSHLSACRDSLTLTVLTNDSPQAHADAQKQLAAQTAGWTEVPGGGIAGQSGNLPWGPQCTCSVSPWPGTRCQTSLSPGVCQCQSLPVTTSSWKQQSSENARQVLDWCDIYKVVKVVPTNRSDNHCIFCIFKKTQMHNPLHAAPFGTVI